MKQKNVKLKFVNWTSKNERIGERLRMSRFVSHLLIYLETLFFWGIKSHKKEHTLKTQD